VPVGATIVARVFRRISMRLSVAAHGRARTTRPWTASARRSVDAVRRRHVDSSAVASVGYDPETAVLEIEFTSGEVYQYFAVPPSLHRELLSAASAGRFFAERIRPVYPAVHVR
jgi:hypothetical protein